MIAAQRVDHPPAYRIDLCGRPFVHRRAGVGQAQPPIVTRHHQSTIDEVV